MSKALTRGLLALYPLAALLFAVGAFGGLPEGQNGWWDRTGFIVNLASGLTAACVGIPTAFFGIQWLVEKRQHAQEVETLRFLLRKNIAGVAQPSYAMLANVIPDSIADAVKAITGLRHFLSRGARRHAEPHDPRTVLRWHLRLISDYYLASVDETKFFTVSQRALAIQKWENISSEVLSRFEFRREDPGIDDETIEKLNAFLRGPDIIEIASDYLEPDYETWVDLVFPVAPSGDGLFGTYDLNYEAMDALIEQTVVISEAFIDYSLYLEALRKAADAVGADITGFDTKAFDPASVDTSPLQKPNVEG